MTARVRLAAQTVAVAIVAGLLGLLVWKVVRGDGNEVTGSLAEGGRPAAPVFSLPRLAVDGGDGGDGELSLASYRGQTVVLNFWASWCLPCKEETPLLQRSWQRWRGKDVVFVGVNAKDFRGDARGFMERYGVTYPNVYDGKGWTIGRYGVTAFPETYFLDAGGRVVYRIAGPVTDAAEIDDGIRRAQASS
ncbi:MAG: TlpA family protein disulfide reductase [Actinobacteria bacterium]|nr:TlpA family protein disulfide reductase [Actinomycetota bacterium]